MGYITDYATGRQLRERPEEQSRQIFKKSILRLMMSIENFAKRKV